MTDQPEIEQMTSAEAWTLLNEDTDAILVDVRTQAEWTFVGVPELSSIDKAVQFTEWNSWPSGHNEAFVSQVGEANPNQEAPVLLLCRSGARSQAAAVALAAAGWTRPINVTAGFEGDLDADQHRAGGWKSGGLPWKQG